MIPVELYGVDAERCERLYEALPALVDDMEDDAAYGEVLYAAEESNILSTVERADAWADATPFAWPDDIAMEVEMALRSARYPDVGLFEHLMTLDGVDAVRISRWAHFVARVYPILQRPKPARLWEDMGLSTPFRPDDIASYGVYVSRIEGLREARSRRRAAGDRASHGPACSSLAWSDSNEPPRFARQALARRCLLGRCVDRRSRRGHRDERLAGLWRMAALPHRRSHLPRLAQGV